MEKNDIKINFYLNKKHILKFFTYQFYNCPSISRTIKLKRNFAAFAILIWMFVFVLIIVIPPGIIDYMILFLILCLPCIIFALITFFMLPIIIKFNYFRHVKKTLEKEKKFFKIQHKIELNENYISGGTFEEKITVKWHRIKNIIKDKDLIYINIDQSNTLFVPISAFDNKLQFNEFYYKIKHYHQNAYTRNYIPRTIIKRRKGHREYKARRKA